MNHHDLKESILKTLAYFDIQHYPLTAPEIWQWLYRFEISDFKQIIAALDTLESQHKVMQKYGYFYLSGREEIIEIRRARLVASELKLKKARRAIQFIKYIPFLKAVFVCNTVAAGTAFEESDIDFFIIADRNRLYIVRFFTNLILRIFGLRTYGEHTADRICLSFFVDDQNLNLEKIKALPEDIHFAYWAFQMMPVYDPENYLKRFFSANHWIKKYIPNFNFQTQYNNLVKPNIISCAWQKIWQTMWRGQYGDLIETQAREWQLLKMSPGVKEKAKLEDNGVVINSGIVKLHEADTRAAIHGMWAKAISDLGL
ncbi:MAG: hypothetical protein NT034_02480 [Candidatus Magasanikbacteria bacterium]|nr:hypothetical protein [Candidatus Magasanikbacteria bacterium]